jgi:hypothetical protein
MSKLLFLTSFALTAVSSLLWTFNGATLALIILTAVTGFLTWRKEKAR